MSIVITPIDGLETTKVDHSDRLQNPSVYLLFWGSYWSGVTSSRAVPIENAAAALISSSFLKVVQQYGVSTNVTLAGFAYDSSNPTSGSFGGSEIDTEVQNQIHAGKFPATTSSNRSIYVVVTAPGILSNNPEFGGFNTEGFDQTSSMSVPECWISTQGSLNSPPNVDAFTYVLSHELAESMTDPGGNGYKVNAGPKWTGFDSGDQIADSEGNLYSFHLSNGVQVQPIWSRRDNAWVVEDGTTQKFFLTPIWNENGFTGRYNLVINEDQAKATGNSLTLGTDFSTGGLEVTLNGETVDFDVFAISNVTINTNGNPYTIQSSAPGVTFTVKQNGGPYQLGFIQTPAQVILGGVLSPVVKIGVLDRNGALVTSDNSYIKLSIASTTSVGVLNGTLTVAAINGVASFTGISLSDLGMYTLEATGLNVATGFSSTITIIPPPFHLAFINYPVSVLAGATMPPVTVAIEDFTNQTMTTANSNVTLSIISGPAGGTLIGSTTVATVNGVASFNDLSFTVKGSYILQATDGTHVLANTFSFSVNANVASQLKFTQGPTNVIAGAFLLPGIQVVLEDLYGNTVTTGGTVSLGIASGPSGGAFINTGTKVPLSGGIGSFNSIALNRAGDYTLVASINGISQISGSFSVSPSAASQIAFMSEPTDSVAGNALSPGMVLAVEDIFGNPVTSDNSSNITLALQNPTAGGTLLGTLTGTVHNGIAAFSNVSLQKTGTYILNATTDTGRTALSSSFGVSAAAPAQLLFTQVPSAATVAGVLSSAPAVEIVDAFGNIVSSAHSTITLSSVGGPSGAALGGTTSVDAVNGVATFSNVSLTAVGTYSLLATDGSLSNATSSFSINPAAVAQLQFISIPHNAYVGTSPPGAISVQLKDRFGNVVSGDGSSVTLGIQNGPAGGTILGSATAIVQNGVATFSNIQFSKAGNFTLKAVDGSVVTAANSAIAVVLPPAKVVFAQQPSTTGAGHSLAALSVNVEDSSGHIVATDNSNITISFVSTVNGVTLHGTLVGQAVNGVATFSNLSITKAGTYSLAATDSNLTPAKSKTFVITPDASTEQLVVLNPPPTTATTGTALLPVLKAALEDQFGNLFTADHSKVTVAMSNGTPGILAGTTTVSLANGVASFSKLSFTKAGNFTLNLTDSNLAAGGTTLNLVILPAPTITALKISASTLASTKPLKLTAVVAAPGITGIIPTGTMTFMDGSTIVGAVPLATTSKGMAVLTISSLAAGTHSCTAVFTPDVNSNSFVASSSLSQSVTIT